MSEERKIDALEWGAKHDSTIEAVKAQYDTPEMNALRERADAGDVEAKLELITRQLKLQTQLSSLASFRGGYKALYGVTPEEAIERGDAGGPPTYHLDEWTKPAP